MHGLGILLKISRAIARPLAVAIVAFFRGLFALTVIALRFFWEFFIKIINRLFVRGRGREIRGGSEPVIRRGTIYRIIARCIDFVILLSFFSIVFSIIPEPSYRWAVEFGVILGYFGGSVYATNSTLGKSLFGIHVVSSVGGRSSLLQLLIREFVSFVSVFVFPVSLYVVMKNRNSEQIGDIIADTRAIKTEPTGIGGLRSFFYSLMGRSVPKSTRSDTRQVSRETTIQDPSSGGQPETTLQSSPGSNQRETTLQQPDGGSTQSAPNSGAPPGDTEVYEDSGKEGPVAGESTSICPKCSKPISQQAKFCPECGGKVS